MANPKFTRKANATLVLMRISGDGWAADDQHLTIGKGAGSHSNYLGRAQVRFPEPDWPSSGRMVRALLTVHESGTGAHDDFRGSSPRLWIKRLSEKPGYSVPDTADGYYTQQGSGDKYPGSTTAGTEKEFNVSGAETHDVTDMVEAMLPTRIRKRNGSPGGNALYGHYQIRSSDEDSASRSFILTDELTLSVEIKTAVTPDAPLVTEVIGAQADTSGPTVVGSTDGRTLEVVFAFRGAAGDTCSKAELAFMTVGATDTTPGTVVRTTGSITPTAGGGASVYRIRLTGLALGAEGRFRVRTTSQKGEQGDWTSLDDDASHVELTVIPGPPLDIVFQPFASGPHVLGTLNSPDPADFLTGAEVEITALPDGITLYAPGPEDIGGASRRSDTDTNLDLQPGQVISFRLRHRNSEQVWGQWSAPRTQTVREAQAVTFSPAPGRLTSLTPTITLTFPLADGARLRLLDPLDHDRVVYDTGATPLTNQTSQGFVIPAGKLAYGQRVHAVGSYVPDGAGTTYTDESEAVTYTVASLPVTVLTVPDAAGGRIGDQSPEWFWTVTDPDGGTIHSRILEIREAATPQGTGAFLTRLVNSPGLVPVVVPGLTIDWETAVDARAWARNDITALVGTQLNGALSAGATSATLDTVAGIVVGQRLIIYSATANLSEDRTVLTLPGGNVVTFDALEHAHLDNEVVSVYQPGPFSPWLTITALQPPDVDLVTPLDAAVLTNPTDTLDWSVTGYGGRTQASAVVTIYLDDAVLATLPIDDATSGVDIPAFLIDFDPDDTISEYGWEVTVTDSLGMVTTSVRRTFTTLFADPVAITVLSASADLDTGSVVLTWDEGAEPYPHNYEVTWIADDGSPVRIDGGPESLLDGNEPFTGATLTHIGARLGDNVYHVAVSNGWRSSEPVSASATLGQPDFRDACLVDEGGDRLGLVATSATIAHAGTIERHHPPGGQPRQVTWGGNARAFRMGVHLIPSEDGEIVSRLRSWAHSGEAVWVKLAAEYALDPVWATLQGFPAIPVAGGAMTLDLDWLELGDPVHAILPAPAGEPPEGEGDIFSSTEESDFGVFDLP